MLAVQNSSQPRFISKIFTDASGRQYRLTFLVALVGGELKGRLVSAEPLAATAHLSGEVTETGLCLPCVAQAKAPSAESPSPISDVVSPYFSLEYLITSQPTRAPSRA